MNSNLRDKLITLAKEKASRDDISHDFQHSLRTLLLAEKITENEGGDLDIIIPAALFHDVVIYPKNDSRGEKETEESAEYVASILKDFEKYPKQKIEKVEIAIKQCSFSKGIVPNFLEAKILQDADRLEATGAISIMRTFSSTGQMKRPFYHSEDPFCENREPEPQKYGLDLFYSKLLKVGNQMHTQTAKELATRRTDFLELFLQELQMELENS